MKIKNVSDKRPCGRHWQQRLDRVKQDISVVDISTRLENFLDRDKWKSLVKAANSLKYL